MPLSYCSYGQSCEMFNEVLVDSSWQRKEFPLVATRGRIEPKRQTPWEKVEEVNLIVSKCSKMPLDVRYNES